MSKTSILKIAFSPLTGDIVVGNTVNNGTEWGSVRAEVTADAVWAVCERVLLDGGSAISSGDGKKYRITVTEVEDSKPDGAAATSEAQALLDQLRASDGKIRSEYKHRMVLAQKLILAASPIQVGDRICMNHGRGKKAVVLSLELPYTPSGVDAKSIMMELRGRVAYLRKDGGPGSTQGDLRWYNSPVLISRPATKDAATGGAA